MFQKNRWLAILFLIVLGAVGCVQKIPSVEHAQIELLQILDKQDPRVAIDQLKTWAAKDQKISSKCHDLLHEIGHDAYKKYNDFATAISYQEEFCNAGYYHGLIEAYFQSFESYDEIKNALANVCTNEHSHSLKAWECFHGTGHGFMYYSGNDVTESVDLCRLHTDLFAQQACINGMYMEVFNLDDKGRAMSVPESIEPLTYCDTVETGRTDCFTYAPTLYLEEHSSDFSDALTWCATAASEHKSSCAMGVGSELMKRHMNETVFVEKTCLSATNGLSDECLFGAYGILLFQYGNLEEAIDQCQTFEKTRRKECENTVRIFNSQFSLL